MNKLAIFLSPFSWNFFLIFIRLGFPDTLELVTLCDDLDRLPIWQDLDSSWESRRCTVKKSAWGATTRNWVWIHRTHVKELNRGSKLLQPHDCVMAQVGGLLGLASQTTWKGKFQVEWDTLSQGNKPESDKAEHLISTLASAHAHKDRQGHRERDTHTCAWTCS